MTRVFEDDLILEKDKTFEESIKVEGDIKRKEGTCPDLIVMGDIEAGNIDAGNINATDINAGNINATDINAGNINAQDISYYGFCIAYKSIECSSIEGRRGNSIHKGLDDGITFKEEPETCPECGQQIKTRKEMAVLEFGEAFIREEKVNA